MLDKDDQVLADYILARVKVRTGRELTWEQLLAQPLNFGGVDTLNDILDSELVPIPPGTFNMAAPKETTKQRKAKNNG